jgi:hypothetical protein
MNIKLNNYQSYKHFFNNCGLRLFSMNINDNLLFWQVVSWECFLQFHQT